MALLASLIYTPALVIWIAAKYVIQNAPAVFSFPLQWWRHRLPNKWLVATWYLVCPSCSAQWTLSTQWYWLNPGGPQPPCCPTAYLFQALKLQLHIFCPSSNPPTFLCIELQQNSNVNGSFHISSPVPNGFGFSILGWVLEKYQLAGRVEVLKSTIGYFRVPFYSWVFLGTPGYFCVYMISFFGGSESNIEVIF